MPVGFVTVVVVTVMLPLTRSRLMPCVVLLFEERAPKLSAMGVAGAAALVMLRAGPFIELMLPALVVTLI